MQTLKIDIKTNGIFSVYRGIYPQLISSVPRSSIRFAVFEQLKTTMQDENKQISSDKRFFCGLIAGGVEAATVMTPAEVIKVQSINKNITIVNTLKSIYNTNGIAGFWKGGVATTIRQSTTQGTSFMI